MKPWWETKAPVAKTKAPVTMNRVSFHCDLQPQIQDTHRTTHRNNHSLQNTEEEHSRGWNDRSRNRRTHEVPFIAGWSHFTRKNKIGFVLRLPPGHKPHATFMQPLQCVSQHHVANLHVSMSMHITRWQQSCSRFTATCNHRFKTRIELRTQDQPLVAEHRGGTQSQMKRPQPQPPHAGGTFHRRPKALYTENIRFRAPASSPTQAPCNSHAAITMCFAASRRKPARIYAHGNTRWQQSCSHSTAICNHRFKTRMQIRTGTTTCCRTQRRNTFADETTAAATAAHTRYLSLPAEATLHGKT